MENENQIGNTSQLPVRTEKKSIVVGYGKTKSIKGLVGFKKEKSK